MSYQYPAVGAHYEGNGICKFIVWAPLREHVELVLERKLEENFQLVKDQRGYWSAAIENVEPGTHYRYRIDHGKSYPDPASCWQPEGVHGPSAVVERSFQWSDQDWKGLSLGEMVLYELHVGTFTQAGTFEAIISKLDYLKNLGINTIELMPVAQFPGTRNWGYDGVFPFAVQHSYGGVNGLKQLVNEAHHRNIAVILDVVYNHLGPEGNYLSEYAPYFTDKYKTNWGQAVNFDDAWCDGVRNYYWQNALMWLEEFHIDGLRLDAVHAIWDFSADHFIKVLREKVQALEERTGIKKVLIAEFDLNNPRYIDPPSKGGYGLDGQWTDEFHHALHSIVTGETNGYYEDFGEVSHLEKALTDSYVYTGEYSIHRKKLFGVRPENNPYSQFVVFIQNHDQVGNRMQGDRLSAQLSFEGLKLAAAVYLLSPHVPMLFMGEEYGEKNPFQYFTSHTDQELAETVYEGRKEEFSYFKWQAEVPDPQSEKTFEQCILSWNHERDAQAATLLAYYKFLISFRSQRKAMQGVERNVVTVFPSVHEKIICYSRQYLNDSILIVMNFNKHPVQAKLPVNNAKKIFDSSAREWNGPGGVIISGNTDKVTQLHPECVMVFEW